MTELKRLPRAADLPTKEELANRPKAPRNKMELSVTNGLYFGIGFWIAWGFVSLVVIPVFICVAFIALSVLGISLGNLGR